MKLAESWVEDEPASVVTHPFHDEVEQVDQVDEAKDGCGGVVCQPYVLKRPHTRQRQERAFGLLRKVYAKRAAIRGQEPSTFSAQWPQQVEDWPLAEDDTLY